MAPWVLALAAQGFDFIKEKVSEHGEDLVVKGIEKVTGIDVKKSKELSAEQVALIKANELKIKELDFEKLKLELEHKKEDNRHEEVVTTNVTSRWESDNKTGNKLAQNVRPLSLLIMLGIIATIILLGFFQVMIPDTYIALIKELAFLIFGAYFTGRTYEKSKGRG